MLKVCFILRSSAVKDTFYEPTLSIGSNQGQHEAGRKQRKWQRALRSLLSQPAPTYYRSFRSRQPSSPRIGPILSCSYACVSPPLPERISQVVGSCSGYYSWSLVGPTIVPDPKAQSRPRTVTSLKDLCNGAFPSIASALRSLRGCFTTKE